MNAIYGSKLNPHRSLKNPRAIKGLRQSIVITHNPSTIGANQMLTIQFPMLSPNDVVVPGTVRLAFNIDLESVGSNADDERTLYYNVARNLIKEVRVTLESQVILAVIDANIYNVYKDLWRPANANDVYRGLENSNIAKLRTGASDGDTAANDGIDKVIADAYGNRYYIPLDFEMLTDHQPFIPSALRDRLTYELTFNDHASVVKSSDTNAKYKILGLSLEFDAVTNKTLADSIRQKYRGKTHFLFEQVQRYGVRDLDKSDTIWNINLNQSIKSLKGILLLFKEPSEKSPQIFYNPKIENVNVTIEGKPNQLYSQGMKRYQHWDEITRFLGDSNTEFGAGVSKDLDLHDMYIGSYLKTSYGLWLDMRVTDDNKSHGSGRRIGEVGGGITIHLERAAETAGDLKCYIFLVMDGQLVVEDGRFSGVYS